MTVEVDCCTSTSPSVAPLRAVSAARGDRLRWTLLLTTTVLFCLSSYPRLADVPLWGMLFCIVAALHGPELIRRRGAWRAPGLLLLLLLLLWIVIVDMVMWDIGPEHGLVSLTIGIIYAVLVYHRLDTPVRTRCFVWVLVLTVSFSAAWGVLQYFWGGFPIWLWDRLRGQYTLRAATQHVYTQTRVAGLTDFPVRLAYQLCIVAPVSLALFLYADLSRRLKWTLVATLAVQLAALLLTFSRSGLLGVVAGFFLIAMHLRRRWYRGLVVLSAAAAILLYVLAGLLLHPRLLNFRDRSTIGRVPLAVAGVRLVCDHPMGVGSGQEHAYLPIYYEQVQHFAASDYVLKKRSHIYPLNVAIYYGIPGLILFLVFSGFLVHRVWRTAASDPFLRALRIGLLGSMLAYALNSLFHNSGPFAGDTFAWIATGVAFALIDQNRTGSARLEGPVARPAYNVQDARPSISVALATYNRSSELKACLESILAQTYPPEQIVVVDNASDDDTPRVMDEYTHLSHVLYRRLPRNLGSEGGKNVATAHTTGDIIITLDDDAVFANVDAIEKTVQRMNADPQLGLLMFRSINRWTGRTEREEFPHRDKSLDPTREFEISYFVGVGYALRRDVYRKVGLYPGDFFYAFEELDLSMRVLDAGYSMLYFPSVVVLHAKAPTGRLTEKGTWQKMLENRMRVSLRHLPWRYVLSSSVVWSLFVFYRSRYSMSVVFGAWRSLFAHRTPLRRQRKVLMPDTIRRIRELKGPLMY